MMPKKLKDLRDKICDEYRQRERNYVEVALEDFYEALIKNAKVVKIDDETQYCEYCDDCKFMSITYDPCCIAYNKKLSDTEQCNGEFRFERPKFCTAKKVIMILE